jgi:predicted ATPase/DNA-binding CsgD family transcriptional regulator
MLPAALTSFVGRERELEELRSALATTRVLTVTGAGGCGKTRLALQAACAAPDSFLDGVWWVELAPLADEALVAATVAAALGVRALPGMTDLDAVCAYLAPRRALVVLDNCEHLLGACSLLATAVLKAAPEVVVLATSRATLGVDGETDWRVPALSPADGSALFVERARKARPDFTVTEHVATVCDRLDGLPLAIELAAARVRMLTVEQLADRLSDRFAVLTDGPRTAIARQQTLRASVDWSYDLLSADEQRLLRRVAVFLGGFTLEAAEQVCDGTIAVLGSLVDKSLVLAEPRERGMRYRLLETVREYGLERLAEAGEEAPIRARHRDAFLALAEQEAGRLESPRQAGALAHLEPDAANLAAAIEHGLQTEPAVPLRMCAALYPFWRARGRLAEAELVQSRALAAGADAPPGLRARVLVTSASRCIGMGDPTAGQELATEALALADEAGDLSAAARARCVLGNALGFSRPAAGRAELARAAEVAQAAGDDLALIHSHLARAYGATLQNDSARARRYSDAVADVVERSGEPYDFARRWSFVGFAAAHDGRLEEARDAAANACAALADVWEPIQYGAAEAVEALADVWAGRHELALERLPGKLERARQAGAGLAVGFLMCTFAFALLAAGRLDQAREQLERLAAWSEGRNLFATAWALNWLAETQRLLGDPAAGATAVRARGASEGYGNRLLATHAGLTLGRLAAARHDWMTARQHALAHLDVVAGGGHFSWLPGCLDALGEVAAGMGFDDDAARLFAAAARTRADLGVARVVPEPEHWAAIEAGLGGVGDTATALTIDDALEWARRARGPRTRPASGWASLTPTEVKVAQLVSEGLTNRQIGERMFISPATVKTHLEHAFTKLDVHNRAELAALHARHV